jgi:hypothetical protein
LYFEYKGIYLVLAGKTATRIDGLIKKGGATPDRCRTIARRPLFEPNVLRKVRSEKRNKK